MKVTRTLAFAAAGLSLAGWSMAGTIESLRTNASQGFAGAPAAAAQLRRTVAADTVDAAPVAVPGVDNENGPWPTFESPVLTDPRLHPVQPLGVGPLVGEFVLSERLDSHRDMITKQFGSQTWDASIAGDAAFKTVYVSFRQKDKLVLRKIEDPNRLRGEGVVLQIDPQTAYRFKVSINIFNPIRGSKLTMDPVNGTQGPAHKMSTGDLLDRIKAKSYVFNANGNEYWLLYGTDVDPKTDQLADTRSFLIIHEAGTSTKAYNVAEASLAADKPTGVSLGDTQVTLVRASDGKLRIHSGGGAGAAAASR